MKYSILAQMINRELKAISTTYGDLYDDSLICDKLDMTLHFEDMHVQFYCEDFRTSFIENRSGDAFYDLQIGMNNGEVEKQCEKEFDSCIVEYVQVFERRLKLDDEDKDLPWVTKVFGKSEYVEDMLVVVFKNRKRLMIVFHPFLTGIDAYFSNNSISQFWEEYKDLYLLKREIR